MDNEQFENITKENITIDNNTITENTENVENNESMLLSAPLGATYYDYYYDRFLENQNTMINNQNTISTQQAQIILQQQEQQGISNTHTTYFEVIIFLICLLYITNVFRNMIRKV